ncbi:hypothetical protein Tco_0493331 [Tanacetum coccineum]
MIMCLWPCAVAQSDARVLINKERIKCQNHKLTFEDPIEYITCYIAGLQQKPFGMSILIPRVHAIRCHRPRQVVTKAPCYSSNLTKPNQKDQVVLEDSPENLANKSIVAEHGLSSEITQSPSGSSNTSEESKNSGSFEDSGRSYEEDSEDGAFSKEGGFETPHV